MWLFSYRFLKHLVTFLCIIIPLQIMGILVLPIYLWSTKNRDLIELPWYLRWFDNSDIYLGRDTSVYMSVIMSGWWNRYCWLAFRNPLNYFGYMYLGYKWVGNEEYIDYNELGELIGDHKGDVGGTYTIEVKTSTGALYEYYAIFPYHILGKSKCFRFRLGWKIGNQDNPTGSYSQWVFVISPYHSYEGTFFTSSKG